MSVTYQRLYSADGVATVRSGVTVADAGGFVPDDLGVKPLPDAIILDAREWETVNVFVDFTDGAGAPATGVSITVEPLIAVATDLTGVSLGRDWLALASLGAILPLAAVEAPVAGHFAAFRVTAIDLTGGAVDGRVRVTGGKRRTHIDD